MKNSDKNIVLTGLMGSGKTTIGTILSKKINYDFIDMDDFIVEISGKTVQELFEVGENHFREWETEACIRLSTRNKTVIASGGGVVKNKENMKCFYDNSIILFLDRPVDNIVADVDIRNRPLLAKGADTLYKLNDERHELYRSQCHHIIDNSKTLDEIVDYISSLVVEINEEKRYQK